MTILVFFIWGNVVMVFNDYCYILILTYIYGIDFFRIQIKQPERAWPSYREWIFMAPGIHLQKFPT